MNEEYELAWVERPNSTWEAVLRDKETGEEIDVFLTVPEREYLLMLLKVPAEQWLRKIYSDKALAALRRRRNRLRQRRRR